MQHGPHQNPQNAKDGVGKVSKVQHRPHQNPQNAKDGVGKVSKVQHRPHQNPQNAKDGVGKVSKVQHRWHRKVRVKGPKCVGWNKKKDRARKLSGLCMRIV